MRDAAVGMTLLKPSEVAERWQVSDRYVTLLAQRGELASVKIGRCVRFTPEAVELFESQNTRRIGSPS
ncbi:hypothetical protein 7S3_33 [uncultured Caudovirales phage]|uniref:Helix-turn-helix domain-containing protein n=1 Tax=uncultured Caudovirales phage TaxID=2100421 RepID=A0A2H4JAW7_9CAUD|nr:hypothetical protein 7S3_33 [uncultured Caudovirales phage]